jgi:hypothetical protein
MIILSICIFNNPLTVLTGISIWFGILVFAAGIPGIIDWFVADIVKRCPGWRNQDH